jgi:hypothetical protein
MHPCVRLAWRRRRPRYRRRDRGAWAGPCRREFIPTISGQPPVRRRRWHHRPCPRPCPPRLSTTRTTLLRFSTRSRRPLLRPIALLMRRRLAHPSRLLIQLLPSRLRFLCIGRWWRSRGGSTWDARMMRGCTAHVNRRGSPELTPRSVPASIPIRGSCDRSLCRTWTASLESPRKPILTTRGLCTKRYLLA